jgi:hypothetical protein
MTRALPTPWLLLVFYPFLMGQSATPHRDPLYERLQTLYFLAAQSENYLPAFEDTLQLLIRRYGAYPSLQMYRYGALALKARYATGLIDKKNYLFTAIESMDAQVQRTPDDLEVRFIRGSFYYYLPAFLGKRSEARADVQALVRLLETQAPQLKALYTSKVLQAVVEFLAKTGWVSPETVQKLRQLYT